MESTFNRRRVHAANVGCGGVDMDDKKSPSIPLSDIYDKNINFLIGSGASYGIAPTLELKIKQSNGKPHSIETLGKYFKDNNQNDLMTTLLMHYYVKCIAPILTFDYQQASPEQQEVIENYTQFLKTINALLERKRNGKQCNIFTTNYDNCFVQSIERLYKENKFDINLNDGAKGFSNKYLSVRNFNSVQYETSPFRQHKTEKSQINLVHLHGSVFWKKESDLTIAVDYTNKTDQIFTIDDLNMVINEFSLAIEDQEADVKGLFEPGNFIVSNDDFLKEYNSLPIVNPTKWKFHETVFEEHYYQMLRYMSYELEKENSALIVFGFSFADEHILNIIKRSLSNPTLMVYICCFNELAKSDIQNKFQPNKQIKFITVDAINLDFHTFNKYVFSEHPEDAPKQEALEQSADYEVQF